MARSEHIAASLCYTSTMKPHVVVSIFLVAAISFAERIAPPTLPPPDFPDTEVSTNIVLAADEGSRHFSVPWNLLRMTARGINEALENFVVRHSPDGTMLIFQ